MNVPERHHLIHWAAVLLLLLMFGLAVDSMAGKAPTFDEQGFLVRGLGYLRGENRYMRVGHPLGLNALNAAFLWDDTTVRLPLEDPSWRETSFHRPAELFMWEIGNDVAHTIFLGRLPTLFLGLLLAALAGRWAWALTARPGAGLLALVLLALDPNILAHTRLTTTDLGLAAGALLAGFTLWMLLRRPGWRTALVAGAGLGLLQNTKFTALLFLPLFALVILIALWQRRRRTGRLTTDTLAAIFLLYPVTAVLVLWATYGFQIGTIAPGVPVLGALGGRTVPLAHHLEQLLDIGGRVQRTTSTFLLGDYSETGWWYYFPVAFALKTPLPTLLLLVWAFFRLGLGRWPAGHRESATGRLTDIAALLIPAGGFFVIALTTGINIGYRHILPILPFLYVFAGAAVLPRVSKAATVSRSGNQVRYILAAALGSALLLITLWIHPHYLAYFNLLAGGPNNGWRALIDSNLDWGQDLPALAEWQRENEIGEIWLSYFGEARPEYYGIAYRGLDSYPPRLMYPDANPLRSDLPAPGVYAISATNLQGVLFQDHDEFAWFRDREPDEKIGYSIFIYRVPAAGPQVDLALGGVGLEEIVPGDYAQLATNDVVPRWFDPDQGLLLPAGSEVWLALRGSTPYPELVSSLVDASLRNEGYMLSRLKSDIPAHLERTLGQWTYSQPVTLADGAGASRFLAGNLLAGEGYIRVDTAWQQVGEPQPVKIFVHLLDDQGQIVSQWDGFGAVAESWYAGDRLLQTHRLDFPAALSPGSYRVQVGLYDPDTGRRWQSSLETDHIRLGEVSLP